MTEKSKEPVKTVQEALRERWEREGPTNFPTHSACLRTSYVEAAQEISSQYGMRVEALYDEEERLKHYFQDATGKVTSARDLVPRGYKYVNIVPGNPENSSYLNKFFNAASVVEELQKLLKENVISKEEFIARKAVALERISNLPDNLF